MEVGHAENLMAIVFITGMSGSGKSTVLAEPGRPGYRVVDTDDDAWTLDEVDDDGTTDRRWLPERVAELVRSRADVVLLSCPEEVMLKRLVERSINSYGKCHDERRLVLEHLATVEPLLRRRATV